MKIQNRYVEPIIKFIDGINLRARKSLGRTKLKEKLTNKNEALVKDQTAIIDEFDGWTDREKGQFTTTNKEMNEAINELLTQEIEITYNSPFRKDFVEALENYDEDLSGNNADMYAVLYETLVEELEGTQNKEEK